MMRRAAHLPRFVDAYLSIALPYPLALAAMDMLQATYGLPGPAMGAVVIALMVLGALLLAYLQTVVAKRVLR